MSWDDLSFWDSGEWQVIEEYLDYLDKNKFLYNPKREKLFAALDLVDYEDVKVVIVGQDPYPKAKHATGLAFSIPNGEKEIPPTLVNIFREYGDDLHYAAPQSGDLTPWTREGVLLWNTCPLYVPFSDYNHTLEWELLNKEMFENLSKEAIVFVLLGAKAHRLEEYIDGKSKVIKTSHPSPLGAFKSTAPFMGSRIFTTVNCKLKELGYSPVDWSLS